MGDGKLVVLRMPSMLSTLAIAVPCQLLFAGRPPLVMVPLSSLLRCGRRPYTYERDGGG